MAFSRSARICRYIALLTTAAALVLSALGGAIAADAPKTDGSIWQRDTLTGDWGGARTALKDNKGIDLSFIYTNELFGVLSGGVKRATSYEGRLEFSGDIDMQKLMGLDGGKAHFTIYQIHDSGRNAVANVGSIADPSDIDALPTTRLSTLWYEQSFAQRFSLRVGQLAADDEFFVSTTAANLINGTFGWAGLLASDITLGGPAYPMGAPGARLSTTLADNLTMLTAVFAGNPAGKNNCTGTAQQCNLYGVNFGLVGGAFLLNELQYAVNQGKDAAGLPAAYKLGTWYQTANFADQRYGVNAAGARVLLSDPTSTGAYNDRGNWGVYGMVDQTVLKGNDRALSFFIRGGFAPSDRNLVSYYVDGGTGLKGPISGRPDDTLTFGIAYAKISSAAAAANIDAGNAVVRDHEVLFELSYIAQLAPWWSLQPSLQYFVHPGGNVPNPNDPTGAAIKNAFVAGVRSTIKF